MCTCICDLTSDDGGRGILTLIGCALLGQERQPLLSHIYLIIIFAPLKLGQYLDYIENVDVKSFVLVSIELLVSEFTFRCTV